MEALTVQQRHLSLPSQCLFAPTELSIPASISKSEFSRLGRALSQIDQADALWRCDYALAGIQQFGKEQGLALAAEATKLTEFNLYKCSFVARKFPPHKRFPNLLFSHYRDLLPFPDEFLDKWLPENADKQCSPRSLRALAVAAFGREPHTGNKATKKRTLSIRAELFARIQQHSPTQQIHQFVEVILESWLAAAPSAGKTAPPDSPSSGNEADDSSPRQTYAERRAAQKAARLAAKEAAAQQRRETTEANKARREAERLAAEQKRNAKRTAEEQQKAELKAAGKFKSKVQIAFVDCKGSGKDFLDTKKGAVRIPKQNTADRFHALEEALEAAREYSLDRHYAVLPFVCAHCSAGRNPVWHLRAASEVNLEKECAEVRSQVNDFLCKVRTELRQQHAQA
jgi:hypothetical protein